MKSLTWALAASFLLCTALPGRASEPDPSANAPDKVSKMQALEEKGDLARARKDYSVAEVYYNAALRLDRQSPVLYNKLGTVKLKQQDFKAARKAFEQAYKRDPKNFVAQNNLGAVAYLQKKYKLAVNHFKQALALDESSAAAHLNLAEAWLSLNEYDHAMTEYTRALELNADILSGSNEGIQARIRTPEQRARIDYLLAKAYAKRGNLDGALEYLRRAKESNYPELRRVYTDQEFAALWKDPRLEKIVKR
jgi:tetratricopeptide (TPR) repeat protein